MELEGDGVLVRALLSQLGAEHVDAFNRRCLCQQVRRIRPQRLRDRTVEVGLASGFIGEGIEDAEGGRPELQGEPYGGGDFSPCQVEALLQELGELLLLAGLGFEADKQCILDHGGLLSLGCVGRVAGLAGVFRKGREQLCLGKSGRDEQCAERQQRNEMSQVTHLYTSWLKSGPSRWGRGSVPRTQCVKAARLIPWGSLASNPRRS